MKRDHRPSWKVIGKRIFDAAVSGELKRSLARYAYAVEVAKADPIEAMHGHYCGPGCFHVGLMKEHEIEAFKKERGWSEWPSVVMERYDLEHTSGAPSATKASPRTAGENAESESPR